VKTSSAKAKGRRHQQAIRDALLEIGKAHGLEKDDIVSTGMGQSGVDIQFSPAALRIFNLDIEAKNRESLNVSTTFFDHHKKYANRSTLKILVHTRNRTEALVTLLWSDFLALLEESIKNKAQKELDAA
jgi:Tat protein secretion system quality control protein TatD with DNase activity